MSDDLKIIEDMQKVMEQMRIDDIEENAASENEIFTCSCCGNDKPKAGSVMYSMEITLCNDCALLAEIGFALKKFENIDELLNSMEDKKLENLCEYIKQQQSRLNN